MSKEELIDELWLDFADESDGWQTNMSYGNFKKAIEKYDSTTK